MVHDGFDTAGALSRMWVRRWGATLAAAAVAAVLVSCASGPASTRPAATAKAAASATATTAEATTAPTETASPTIDINVANIVKLDKGLSAAEFFGRPLPERQTRVFSDYILMSQGYLSGYFETVLANGEM